MKLPEGKSAKIMTFLGMMTLPVIWAVGLIGSELRHTADLDAAERARAASEAAKASPVHQRRVGQNTCVIVSSGHYGCLDPDSLLRLWQRQIVDDEAAFLRVLLVETGAGRCRLWDEGERITVQDDGTAIACIRPTKGTVCYWTDRAAIED